MNNWLNREMRYDIRNECSRQERDMKEWFYADAAVSVSVSVSASAFCLLMRLLLVPEYFQKVSPSPSISVQVHARILDDPKDESQHSQWIADGGADRALLYLSLGLPSCETKVSK